MPKTRSTAFLAMIVLGIGACSSGANQVAGGDASRVGERATVSHIHGLGIDSQGVLHVATHLGLIKQHIDGSFVYASADRNDHMGFSLHAGDGVMYRSGHSPSKPSLGVESSTDGARWTHVSDVTDPPVDFHAMAVSFADSKTVWGYDSGGRGTFRSTDGGETWTRLTPRGLNEQIYVLAGSAHPNVIYAGTASGFSRSDDGGTEWRRVFSSGWVIGIATDPADAKRLIISTQAGLKTTADGGATWREAGRGLPKGAEIAHLAISALDPDVGYAADASRIFKTTDGGQSWGPLATDR